VSAEAIGTVGKHRWRKRAHPPIALDCFIRIGQRAPEGGDRSVLTQLVDLAQSLVSHDDEDGQGLAEYALILALIAIVSIVALLFLGSQISDKLSIIGSALESQAP
jgi:pilus assembly protein Flp/PilA